MTFRKEVLAEGVEVYCGDCLEVLPTLGSFDAVVSDPPYGIGFQKGAGGKGIHSKRAYQNVRNEGPVIGDDKPFDPTPWLAFDTVILWGANHFARALPDGRWLAWNKLGDLEPWDSFSDVEFAWQNKRGADRIFSHLWKGLAQAGAGEKRFHPTQKPVSLMSWCLTLAPSARSILDPFMGSGTTGVAAVRAGLSFTGIEIDADHFEKARERISAALRQPDIFSNAKAEKHDGQQEVLFG